MTKHTHGVEYGLMTFYKANPGEWLTLADIMLKFGCTRRSAVHALVRLRREGFILQRVSVYVLKQQGPT